MASNDIGDWYRGIPQITRYWFTGSVIVPIAARLGLIHVGWLVLSFQHFVYHFQFWRPVTAALFYPISGSHGFHYLMNLFFLYSYSTRLETGVFEGKPADYLFMLLFNWLCLVVSFGHVYYTMPVDDVHHSRHIVGFAMDLMVLMEPLVLSVLYVWCQLHKDTVVQFWFGTQFKAMYLPWCLLAFNLIIGSGGMMQLFGIVVGHLYFFLMFKYPMDFGTGFFPVGGLMCPDSVRPPLVVMCRMLMAAVGVNIVGVKDSTWVTIDQLDRFLRR